MSRRHFGPQHLKNGYAEMAGSRGRPHYPSIRSGDLKASIEAERRKAAAEAKRRSAKKG
jgi:hypothetical protein